MIPESAVTNRGVSMGECLEDSFQGAVSVDIAVSFLKESGFRVIGGVLRQALARGVGVRLLTGTYLGITSPFALEELLDLEGDMEVHLYSEQDVSFHPKAYIFHYPDPGDDAVFVGSSNLSASALSDGVEWNYRLMKRTDPLSFDRFQAEFDYLFTQGSVELTRERLEEYRSTWRKPPLPIRDSVSREPEARGPQISALAALRRTREAGMTKALVVASTGVGKTFIAAKDSETFDSVLFVAHRLEILEQAEATFRKVRPDRRTGFLYGGRDDRDVDVLFASVQTLSRGKHYERIPEDRFEYMVVDEFHHAASDSYLKVVNHFKPKFLLGLTATPERLDRKDIFALCNYNVPYEIGLEDAIRYGSLVPFSYHGIADGTDYDAVKYRNGRYDEDDLTRALSNERRAELILRHYRKYPTKKALGFCSSVEHALFMRDRFKESGVNSMCVVSRGGDDRHRAVRDLEDEKISVIFTVDMFNEGVDIPSVDMVMFLRPTESPAVFLQQLGRGLRLHDGKERLTALDFIGNYRKVEMIPSLLTGCTDLENPGRIMESAPPGCVVDFDLESIDIMRRMARRKLKLSERMDEEFDRIMESLGHVPSRVDLFMEMDHDLLFRRDCFSRNYLGYLTRRGLASPVEVQMSSGPGGDFIRMVENTDMEKLYKMPVILAFFRDGRFRTHVSDEELAGSFAEFYARDNNKVDLEKSQSWKPPEEMSEKDWIRLARNNPVHFLTKTESRFFSTDGSGIDISKDLVEVGDLPDFRRHVMDAIAYRTLKFKESRYNKEAGHE